MLPNYPSSQLSLGHYILFSNNRLGSGAFGDVYRGQNIINNQKIATKKRKKKIKENSFNINIIKTNEGNINNKSSSLVDIMNNKNIKIHKKIRIENIYNDYGREKKGGNT